MKSYTLSQDTIARSLRRVQWTAVTVCILVIGIFVAIMVTSAQNDDGLRPDRTLSAVVIVVILSGLLGFNMVRMYRQQRKRLQATRVEFGDDMIARPEGMLPRVEIRRDEVTSIEEIQAGLCVAAAEPRRIVIVPVGLDDYEGIKATLSGWAPIKPQSALSRWLGCLPGLALLIGFAILFFSWSLWLVLPVALAIVGFFGYVLWQLRRAAKTSPGLVLRVGFGMAIMVLLIALKIGMTISLMDVAP